MPCSLLLFDPSSFLIDIFVFYDVSLITSENDSFDETHPLYRKRCVFTGALERMSRLDAAQLVANVGGIQRTMSQRRRTI